MNLSSSNNPKHNSTSSASSASSAFNRNRNQDDERYQYSNRKDRSRSRDFEEESSSNNNNDNEIDNKEDDENENDDELMILLQGDEGESGLLAREKIRSVMGYCIDKAANSKDPRRRIRELMNIIIPERFDDDDFTAQMLISRLYIMSDILYNSPNISNATYFRNIIQIKLPGFFVEMFEVKKKPWVGRLTQEGMKLRVEKVLSTWQSWFLFSDKFISGLRCNFIHGLPSPLSSGQPLPVLDELKRLSMKELEYECKNNAVYIYDCYQGEEGNLIGDKKDIILTRLTRIVKYQRGESLI